MSYAFEKSIDEVSLSTGQMTRRISALVGDLRKGVTEGLEPNSCVALFRRELLKIVDEEMVK